jgi:hypothetical protein
MVQAPRDFRTQAVQQWQEKFCNGGKNGQRDELKEYFSEEEDWRRHEQVTASLI